MNTQKVLNDADLPSPLRRRTRPILMKIFFQDSHTLHRFASLLKDEEGFFGPSGRDPASTSLPQLSSVARSLFPPHPLHSEEETKGCT